MCLIVSKIMLRPENMDRFCNFLVPESSQIIDNNRHIDFNGYLSKINVRVVGIFGTKQEIKKQLSSLTSVSSKLLSLIVFTFVLLYFWVFFRRCT